MGVFEAVAVLLAGVGAGFVNTIVGSGSLITYPVMVLCGVPPVVANVSNTVGLVPGSIAGFWSYRRQLQGTPRSYLGPSMLCAAGAVCGAYALTRLPAVTFQMVVPFLILAAAVLVAMGPRFRRPAGDTTQNRQLWLHGATFAASVYGGYFSAAQGVIFLGIFALLSTAGLQEQIAVKNLLQAVVNVVAAVFFVFSGHVAWLYALCVAAGSLIGAPLGAYVGVRLPAGPFRVGIVCFGLTMACVMAVLAFV